MSDHLKKRAVSGIKWNGCSMLVTTLLNLLTFAILARLLVPSDFGLLGMIVIVVAFAQQFSDMGLGNAIIHKQDIEAKHLSSLFWLNLAAGAGIFLLIVLSAPLIADFFKQPILSKYLVVAAAIFLIIPFGQIFKALLQKELQFETLSKIEIFSMVLFSGATIGLALANYGVLSLIVGQIIRSLVEALFLIGSYRKQWLPKLYFNLKEIRSYVGFGAFQMGERIANYFAANMDYILVGRFLGSAALGFYTFAYQLTLLPMSQLNPVITRVAFPVFSKIQKDNISLRGGYSRAINFISTLSFPLLFGLLIVAPEFIHLIFGSKWDTAIPVIRILCFVGLFKSLGNPVGSVLLAKGRANLGFYFNVCTALLFAAGVFIGIQKGIVGVALAILILQIPIFATIQTIVNRLMEMKIKEYLKAIRVPLLSSVIMMLAVYGCKALLGDVNLIASFSFPVLLGALTYGVTYYLFDRNNFKELLSFLRPV